MCLRSSRAFAMHIQRCIWRNPSRVAVSVRVVVAAIGISVSDGQRVDREVVHQNCELDSYENQAAHDRGDSGEVDQSSNWRQPAFAPTGQDGDAHQAEDDPVKDAWQGNWDEEPHVPGRRAPDSTSGTE